MAPRFPAALTGLLALVLLLGWPRAEAAGTIDTTNTEFTIGAGAPAGATLVDANAPGGTVPPLPPLGDLGAIGSPTGALPAFPGAGNGSDGAFLANTDTTLTESSYEFSSFTVSGGAVVTCTGPTVIHVVGAVTVDGSVTSTAGGASIELRCGGDFTLLSNNSVANLMNLTGSGAGLTIHAGGNVMLGTGGFNNGAELRCSDGVLSLFAHGLTPAGGNIVTDRAFVFCPLQSIQFVGSAGIEIGAGRINSGVGAVELHALGAGLSSGSFFSTNSADYVFEAAEGMTLTDGGIDSGGGSTTLVAFGGDLVIEDVDVDGQSVTGHASGAFRMLNGACIFAGDGGSDLRAFGGDVRVGEIGGTRSAVGSSRGDSALSAMGDILIANADLDSSSGDFVLRAFGGDVRVTDDATIESSAGLVDIRAPNSIFVENDRCFGGGRLLLSAGDGGIDCTSSELRGNDGSFEVLSTGPIRLRSSCFTDGDVTIRSSGGDVDLATTDIRTENGSGDPSASILVEAWQPQCILLADSELRTGTSSVQSGSISVLIRGAGDAPGDVKSYFLPKFVKVKLNAGKPERSQLKAAGFFDVGPGNPDLSGMATLDVGDVSVTASLDVKPNGRVFRLVAPGVDFLIKRAGSGSSRTKFRLKIRRDIAGLVPTDGDLAVRFRSGTIDGTGKVSVEGGRYKLGRKRGLLAEPVLFPFFAKSIIKGGGKDTLSVRAGISTNGDPPAVAPDVTITFRTLVLAVASGDFSQKSPGVFVAKNPPSAPGVKKVTIDYGREAVSLSAKDLDLGAVPEGAFDSVLGVKLGAVERTVEVTTTRVGKKVKY